MGLNGFEVVRGEVLLWIGCCWVVGAWESGTMAHVCNLSYSGGKDQED
jgi:hypothetical protein